jgi:hypothetical protein
METFSSQPQENRKHKSKFQTVLLISLIVILTTFVVLDVLLFTGKISKKDKGELGKSESSLTEKNKSENPETQGEKTWKDCKVLPNEKDYLPEAFGSFAADTIEEHEPKGWLGKYYGSTGESDSAAESLLGGMSIIVRKDKNSESYIKEAFDLDKNELTKNLHGAPTFVGVIMVNHNNADVRLTLEGFTSVISIVEKHQLVIEMAVRNQPEVAYGLWFDAVCKKA